MDEDRLDMETGRVRGMAPAFYFELGGPSRPGTQHPAAGHPLHLLDPFGGLAVAFFLAGVQAK